MAWFMVDSDKEMKIKGKIQPFSAILLCMLKSYLVTTPAIPAT
jgi:hypothetical protein